MSRLVMLSDETGLRAYAGVAPTHAPAPRLARLHRIDYSACKDPAGRANTVETRHLLALRRISAALSLVPAESQWHCQIPVAGAAAPSPGPGPSPVAVGC
jgi:hypothetical protein